MATNPLLNGLQPMQPGEMLREDVLPSLGKSKTEIASLLGISRQTLFGILTLAIPTQCGSEIVAVTVKSFSS